MAIAVFHSSSEYRVSACDTYDFQAVRTGLSCSSKQLLAVGSTIEVEQKLCKQKSSCKSSYIIEQLRWNGHDCNISMQDCQVTTL